MGCEIKFRKSSRNLSREEVPQKGGEVWIYLDFHTCTKGFFDELYCAKTMSRMSLELIERFHPMQVLHLPAREKTNAAQQEIE